MLQVLGDSHCVAYLRVFAEQDHPVVKAVKARFGGALACPLHRGGQFTQDDFLVRNRGLQIINKVMAGRLRRQGGSPFLSAQPPAMIVYTASFLLRAVLDINQWQRFTTDSSDTSRSFVSAGVLRAMFTRVAAGPWGFLSALKETGNNVAFLEAPPLYASYFARIEDGHTRRRVLEIQTMHREFHRQALTRLGIPVVAVPSGLILQGGLRPEFEGRYRDGDISHGSPGFALEMLKELLIIAEKSESNPSPVDSASV